MRYPFKQAEIVDRCGPSSGLADDAFWAGGAPPRFAGEDDDGDGELAAARAAMGRNDDWLLELDAELDDAELAARLDADDADDADAGAADVDEADPFWSAF